jgi:osmotically inducible lipoprotein OsmB
MTMRISDDNLVNFKKQGDVMYKSKIIVSSILLLTLAACSDWSKSDTGTAIGATTGAVAGGLIGSTTGSTAGTVIGAGVGAAAGGVVGHEVGKSMESN